MQGHCSALGSSDEAAVATEKININTASVMQLTAIPKLGAKKAANIKAWQEMYGEFVSIKAIGDVDGIGPVLLNQIRKYCVL